MIDKEILFNRKDALLDMRQVYEENGTINWSTFSSNQSANKNKVVLLSNNDFKYGTLRIREPCLLRLTGHIVFNPNRPEKWYDENGNVTTDVSQAAGIYEGRKYDWMPHLDAPNNSQYFEPEVHFAYTLGFFAAIAIECPFVIVDLNGYNMSQHKEHSLQQKFYSHIELADQPFIPMQGPSNFGNILRSARDVYIYNGSFGICSHHHIHGNSNDGVFIENLTFENFEVAAISLNGSKNTLIQNVNVRGNNKNIPVLGTYSVGRFNRLMAKKIINAGLGNTQLQSYLDFLIKRLNSAFDYFIFGKGFMPVLFENDGGLLDGNAYGIVINPTGIAVNGFLDTRNSPKANETLNVYIENASVNGIHGNIREVVCLDNGVNTGKVQTDVAGAVLQFFDHAADLRNGKYFYKGTAISDIQIEIAKIRHNLIQQNNYTSQNALLFGTISIQRGIQLWHDNPNYFFKTIETGKLQLYDNDTKLPVQENGESFIYTIVCNGDTMFHVDKGVIGIRIDGCNGSKLHNCMVTNIKNYGKIGSRLAGSYIKSHPLQNSMIGYHGNNTHGVICCAVNDMVVDNLNIIDVYSKTGVSKGFALLNESSNSCLEDITIKDIVAGTDIEITDTHQILPNKYPIATGFNSGHDVTNLIIKSIDVKDIVNNVNCPFNKPYDINGEVKIN